MNKEILKETRSQIRNLYKNDSNFRKFFDLMADHQKDATSTSIDRICQILSIDRATAVAMARTLESAGCGQFIVGRKGSRSRFEWRYSRISLGQVAKGSKQDIDALSDDALSEETEEALERAALQPPFTIAEAKRQLAAALGVNPDQIEIQVRA